MTGFADFLVLFVESLFYLVNFLFRSDKLLYPLPFVFLTGTAKSDDENDYESQGENAYKDHLPHFDIKT